MKHVLPARRMGSKGYRGRQPDERRDRERLLKWGRNYGGETLRSHIFSRHGNVNHKLEKILFLSFDENKNTIGALISARQ
jgi:hypothetical protein